jgi:hypothetical protein
MVRVVLIVFSLLGGLAQAQEQVTTDILKDLKKRVEALEGAPAKATLNAFNPAIGMAIDSAFRDNNDKAGFSLRAAELNIEAPVDTYLKAWTVITGSNGGVELEEAGLETTSLPNNLTIRGGRLFASFGRLGHFHDHELPVIDRPTSLDQFIGGETQADGIEVSFLVPVNFFLNATVGSYNKMGAENERQSNQGTRPMDEFTYLGRLNTYFDLTDNQNVELGASSAWTPKRAVAPTAGGDSVRRNTWRTLSGVDLTYRYQPASGGLYRRLTWGTEVLQNQEMRFDATANTPTDRIKAYAGYSYLEAKFDLRWRGGVMADLTEDQDNPHRLTKTFSGFLTFDVTNFQRLRASYAQSFVNVAGTAKNHIVGLQWTAVIGHHVHGFRDR